MTGHIEKLVSIGSHPLGNSPPKLSEALLNLAGALGEELYFLLSQKNGFYAFESALHVFPAGHLNDIIELEAWNSEQLWKECYGSLTENCLFFAEDIFGGQFCVLNNKICSFDPETGDIQEIADNFERWAKCILDDYNMMTGYSLAHSWQEKYGAIPVNRRLLPKIPFVCGGEFKIDNLYLVDAVKGMKFRADIAKQIRDCPDGSKITIRVID